MSLLATLAWKRWSPRSTLLLAFFLFATALYRYALARSDAWHQTGGMYPVYLFFIGVLGDACAVRLRWARRSVATVAVATAAIALYAIWQIDDIYGLTVRARKIASGEEAVLQGPPHVYPDLPHAGDAIIEPPLLQLVRFIREKSKPSEPIWVLTHFIGGTEIYFLAERRVPTRFSLWCEVTLRSVEAVEVLEDMKRDPPKLIIGHGWRDYRPDIVDWLNAHYKVINELDGAQVREYAPEPSSALP